MLRCPYAVSAILKNLTNCACIWDELINLAEMIKGYNRGGPPAISEAVLLSLEASMKRLLCVMFIVLASPLMVSVSNHLYTSPSASMVAYAGRTLAGGAYCDCGTSDCITEPGECGNSNSATVASGGDTTTSARLIDSGTGVMMLAFILLLWMRFGSK
jgi:hypothetical protein